MVQSRDPTGRIEPRGALHGIRVVDMTTAILGPYATRIFGDLGADVIKVESPVSELVPRHGGPQRSSGMGALHMSVNRNKRSVRLDLQKPKNAAAAKALIETSDVFIHSVRQRSIEKLGLAYEQVKALNEKLVYVHCSGYGSGGPYSGRQAYDDLIQGASGMTDLLGRRNGTDAPAYLPSLLADKTAGLHAAYAVLAALFHRERHGEGQFIEVPMFECVVSFHLVENLWGAVFDPPLSEAVFPRNVDSERRPVKAKDGFICLMPAGRDGWLAFFRAVGREDVLESAEFREVGRQPTSPKGFYDVVEQVAQTKTVAEWLELLDVANVPVMKSQTMGELFDDEHLQSVGFFERRRHPTEGAILSTAHPVLFGRTPAVTSTDARRLGDDTEAVLSEIGMTIDDVEI
ncbi:MAG: CoA transferase [Pseudomonadales bacterium]